MLLGRGRKKNSHTNQINQKNIFLFCVGRSIFLIYNNLLEGGNKVEEKLREVRENFKMSHFILKEEKGREFCSIFCFYA